MNKADTEVVVKVAAAMLKKHQMVISTHRIKKGLRLSAVCVRLSICSMLRREIRSDFSVKE